MFETSDVRAYAIGALLSTPNSPSTYTSRYTFRSNAVIFAVVPALVSENVASVNPKSLRNWSLMSSVSTFIFFIVPNYRLMEIIHGTN